MPDEVDESMRDLTRARADAVHDLTRAKQRLKAFLLRQGYRYPGKANWSEAHQRYLRKLTLPLPALRSVLEEQLLAIDQATERVKRLDELIEVQVPQWRYYPAVQAVMCLRGFQLNAATVIVAELGDVRRFAHPKNVMAFLGLVPKEETTGNSRRLGSITKAGNAQARWCLIEAIQKALTPPKVSARLSLRQEGQPAVVQGARLEDPGPPPQAGMAPAPSRRDEGQGQRRPRPRARRIYLGSASAGPCPRSLEGTVL